VLIELLRRAAAEVPDHAVLLSPDGRLTYAECLRRSEALARGLRAHSIERFACLLDDVGDLLALLCASSAIGSEACVYPDGLDADGVRANAALFKHPAVVTDRTLALTAPPVVVPVQQLATDDGELSSPPARAPALILTTGTTGRQRGARHDWARLVESTRHPDMQPDARWLVAYNLSQFAGLQILLHALLSHATLVVGRSRQPRDGLAAMRDLGVTHVSATPTFWRFVVRSLDEASAHELGLRQITLGGEAVPASLLDQLKRLFPAVRISQIYGATEFGLGLSVRDGRPGLPLSLLERGEDADVRFRIIDGELHVRSRIGMLGYHGEDDTGDGWRPTGDLVEVRGDRIRFVGRSGETINVGGVKVHPLPVEELVSGVDGVELARAYARSNPITGQIVAVDVVPRPGVDHKLLERDVRAACAALPPAGRPQRIRFVDELDVEGHKIARRQRVANR
jgi:acyl-CoA synthetase (AMP-forming)/AMP-acid ligase II